MVLLLINQQRAVMYGNSLVCGYERCLLPVQVIRLYCWIRINRSCLGVALRVDTSPFRAVLSIQSENRGLYRSAKTATLAFYRVILKLFFLLIKP